MTPKKKPEDLLKRGRKPRNVTSTQKPPLNVTPNPPPMKADSSGGSNSDESFTITPVIIPLDDKGGIIPVNSGNADKEKLISDINKSGEFKAIPVKEPEISPLQLAMNAAMLNTFIMVINKTVTSMTGNPKLAFDDDETEQLVALWSPFIPKTSPLTNAIIGTVIIVGGKVGVYMVDKRNEKKKEVNNGKSDFNAKLIKEKQDEVSTDLSRS